MLNGCNTNRAERGQDNSEFGGSAGDVASDHKTVHVSGTMKTTGKYARTHMSRNRLNAAFWSVRNIEERRSVFCVLRVVRVFVRFADNLIYLLHALQFHYYGVLLCFNTIECPPHHRSSHPLPLGLYQPENSINVVLCHRVAPIKIKLQKAINFIGCWFYIFISPVEARVMHVHRDTYSACNEREWV